MAQGTPIPIVVDGSNVAFEHETKDGKPRVANIVAVRQALMERGYKPIIIVDASLWHRIDDPDHLDALIEQQQILQVPAGTDADYFIIKTAEAENTQIVTNDRYQDRQAEYPWVEERRVPLMIINGKVQLYEESLEEKPASDTAADV